MWYLGDYHLAKDRDFQGTSTYNKRLVTLQRSGLVGWLIGWLVD